MSDNLHDFKMPSFGADMAKGRLIEWLVKEGDSIKRGAVIAVIETNKGAIDLDIFEDAVIEKLLLKAGEEVTVGTPIVSLRSINKNDSTEETDKAPNTLDVCEDAVIEKSVLEAGEEVTVGTPIVSRRSINKNDSTEETLQPEPIEQSINNSKPAVKKTKTDKVPYNTTDFVTATPAARALAVKQQLSLTQLRSDNNNKIITLEMVKKAAGKPPAIQKTEPSRSGFDKETMRQAICETVTRSKQQIPHYYLSHTLDITVLEQYLQQYNEQVATEDRLLLAAPLLCAIAQTLMKNKPLNGSYQQGAFIPSDTVNLANAINLRGGGLVMPVIRDAQTLDPSLMMQRLKEQVARARSGTLRFSELNGGSCTVTSIGDRGAEQMFAVIYPPQVAIIALGSAFQKVMAIQGEVQIRSVIKASLAADHRVSDGRIGASMLYQLNQLLQQPEDLWTVCS